jgi:ATP-dependent 26S proteasome regulatory subunit
MPTGIVLEKPGRNLDSLTQTDALKTLTSTLIHEWRIRDAFEPLEQFGIRPTTMALFYGPPGNGKTMASKMLANVISAPLYRVSCEGLLHSYLGKSEENIRDVMAWLAEVGEAVVLFDECESLFRKRSAGDGCSQAIVRTMQVFWQALDRWETPQMFLLATNRIQDIDEALLSRCEIKLEFVGPTADQAMLVLEYWAETLHEHGAEEWAPALRKQIKKKTPESFRELWQMISFSVRQWIIRGEQQ